MIKTVKDIELAGKRVIMRVDFNVPMKEGKVQDDTRIMAALPTINYVLAAGAKSLVLMSHLGDPDKDAAKAREKAEKDGKSFDLTKYLDGKHRMKPVADYLSAKLGKPVVFLPSCFGQKAAIDALPAGSVVMLENTRFHKEETSKDPAQQEILAKELASYGDVFVNDAFGSAHRAHASTATIAKFSKVSVGGFLMEKEV
ncbi:MAG TPA: phosphoglycerate kinase, partial [Rectinemataceae bacterium]|nr:phosphoglycerate kinase [Rectinemataceae bacterium]